MPGRFGLMPNDIRALVKRLTDQLRVTKLTATRTVRGNQGETFAGFSASSQSTDDRSGMLDLPAEGLPVREARLSYYVLAMYADISAIDAAWAGGSISDQHRTDLSAATKRRYSLLIRQYALSEETPNGSEP